MDKRKIENIRVKKDITDTLLALMHEKSFAKITITEIIEKANVARASFYRNYDSKEDVLMTLVDDVLDDFMNKADYDLSNYYTYDHVLRCFQYFKRYDKYMLSLCEFGYGSRLLYKLNRFHEKISKPEVMQSVDKYKVYIFMGALFNTAVNWLESGAKEAPEEIARVFCEEICN